MDLRDQELLDRQLHGLGIPPRNDGVMMLGIATVFFIGMALGGFLYAYTDQPGPMRVASNDMAPGLALLQGAPQTTQR
jgi:hypothetical protein